MNPAESRGKKRFGISIAEKPFFFFRAQTHWTIQREKGLSERFADGLHRATSTATPAPCSWLLRCSGCFLFFQKRVLLQFLLCSNVRQWHCAIVPLFLRCRNSTLIVKPEVACCVKTAMHWWALRNDHSAPKVFAYKPRHLISFYANMWFTIKRLSVTSYNYWFNIEVHFETLLSDAVMWLRFQTGACTIYKLSLFYYGHVWRTLRGWCLTLVAMKEFKGEHEMVNQYRDA